MSALQMFPALDSATEAALRASIERFGVLVPVVTNQNGQLLDGHHRSRIADELGVEYDTRVVETADEDEAREIARTLNADRRHLTVEQRRPVVVALREQGHSTRAIAGALGVDHSTVVRDAQKSGGATAPPERVEGQDGKSYPATNPPQAKDSSRITFSSDTPRGQEQRAAHVRKTYDLLSHVEAIRFDRDSPKYRLDLAIDGATPDDLRAWEKQAAEGVAALTHFRRALKEGRRAAA